MAAVFHPVNPFEQALIDSLPIEVLINVTNTMPNPKMKRAGSLPERSGHRLRLHLYEARELPATTWFSKDKSDTYVSVGLQGTKTKVTSAIITETTHPTYNEAWDFHLSHDPLADVLSVTVHSRHSITSDDFLGRIEVPLSVILSMPAPRKLGSCWFPLLPKQSEYNYANPMKGSVRIGFEYFFDPSEAQLRLLQEQAMALNQLRASPAPLHSVPHPAPPTIHSVPYIAGSFTVAGSPPTASPASPAAAQLSRPSHPPPHLQLPSQQQRSQSLQSRSERCPVCNAEVTSDRLASHVESHFPEHATPSPTLSPAASPSPLPAPPGYRPVYPINLTASAQDPAFFSHLQPLQPQSAAAEKPYPVPSRPVPPLPEDTPEDREAKDLAEAIRLSEEMAQRDQPQQQQQHFSAQPLRARPVADLSQQEAHLMNDLQSAIQRRTSDSSRPSAPPLPPREVTAPLIPSSQSQSQSQSPPVASPQQPPQPRADPLLDPALASYLMQSPYPPPLQHPSVLYPSVPLPYVALPYQQGSMSFQIAQS
ncbi:MAG: hypothetical protein Q8P67_28325 [archaeon]|nr:hypothetical protein [archaeon]